MLMSAGRHSRAGKALLVFLVAILVSATPGIAVSRQGKGGGLVPLGPLRAAPKRGNVIQVDPIGRRLYYMYVNRDDGRFHIIDYDLRPRHPRPIRDSALTTPISTGPKTPYTIAMDRKRSRLLSLAPSQVGVNEIYVFDLKKMETSAVWNLSVTVPGFLPMGITYSPEDDIAYVVGEFSQSYPIANGALTFTKKPAGPLTSIVALRANNGEVAWVRPIPECQQALYSLGAGSLIVRSSRYPALYLACVTGGLGAGDAFPGHAGLVRMWIGKDADQEAATQFDVEFFSVSGSYFNGAQTGMAGFDHTAERFYIQSLSKTTPGAWVFDGRLSAWVGFIAAPDNQNAYLGVNQGNGHYYMASDGYVLVSDGRATPVPQGSVFPVGAKGFIPTDPRTDRLFVAVPVKDGGYRWIVMEDRTPRSERLRLPDYDELTSDAPEGPNTVTNFSGGINGFGARLVLVGGYAGLLGASGQQIGLGNLRAGDRGLTAARVPTLDLREGVSTARSQGLVSDANTAADLSDFGVKEWPWPSTSCFDGGGDAQDEDASGPAGGSDVSCSLEDGTARASAYFGELAVPGISIASSRFDARSWRDPKKGVIALASSSATGIELSVPDGGSVSIDRVTATATTLAHGHSGTAKARWRRVISGIEVRDANENVVQRVAECTSSPEEDDCERVFHDANRLLQMRMRIRLPEPEVIHTPKGAFAGVEQSDADFFNGRTVNNQGTTFSGEASTRAVPALEVVVTNDSVEKSRLIVQLAAIQADAIYTISPRPKPPTIDVDGDDLKGTLGPSVSPVNTSSGLGPELDGGGLDDFSEAAPAPAPAPVSAAAPTAVQGVLAFFVSGPKEGLLAAGLWLLFAASGFGILRRSRLINVLTGHH